jgi:hypothetical protein
MLTGIQILGIIFGLVMLYFTFYYHKRRDFSKIDVFLWFLIWSSLVLVILFPKTVEYLIEPLHIIRVMDLLVIASILILFAIVFFMYWINRSNERKIDELVRKIALKEFDKKNARK